MSKEKTALIVKNKNASRNFKLDESFQAGIVLEGWEVKSLRDSKVDVKNSYVNILKGEDDAATKYLNKTTSDSLYTAFKPIVEKAIKTVKVTQYWNPLATRYNKIPLTTKINPDLEDYTTKKAIEGLFKLLAKEEKAIREQPSARVTDLLKKVFSE